MHVSDGQMLAANLPNNFFHLNYIALLLLVSSHVACKFDNVDDGRSPMFYWLFCRVVYCGENDATRRTFCAASNPV